MTALLRKRSVIRYIKGLKAAYIIPGTAKQTPINAGENPYLYMCTAKEGAKNYRHAATRMFEMKPKKNLTILKRGTI